MPAELPTLIGRYEIQRKLGEGAFGRVYRGYDPTVNRLVAIKVLLATDKEILTRFKNEAMVAGNLRHKNVVTIYEFGEHEGRPFLAMEFLGGRNLQELMRCGEPLSVLQKIDIMAQVAEGLECAHRNGVVHRDVKPANIMVLPDGTVKIMDFGIARLTGDREVTRLTKEGNVLGTLLYMAPEQFIASADIDALCDIFAYGEIYFELLAGKHPFEATDARVLIYKLNTQHPPPIRSLVPDCPDAMDQVLNRLLAKERDLRYQSMRELLYDTQPILLELKQDRAASLTAEALELFQQQKLEEASRLMPEILELDPGNRTAYRLREGIQKELRDRVVRPRIDALLKTGREEMERRNFPEAINAFDSALRLDTTNTEIQGLLESARTLQAKSQRAAELLAEARRAFNQENLAEGYRSASEALLHDPQNSGATRLLQVIQAAIDHKRQQQWLEQALSKAQKLLLIQEFAGALAVMNEFDARDPQVENMVARIRTQKLEHERSARLQAGMATATELLRNRRLSEAVDHLTRLFADFPEAAELRQLLDYASNELAAEERAQAVLRIDAEAQAHAGSRDFSAALDVLEKALQKYDDSSLVRLLGTVMAAKAAWELEETVRTTKEQCDRWRAEGRLADAIQAAQSAVRRYSAEPVLVELLRELERQPEQEKRNQDSLSALAHARKLLDGGEFEKAGRFLQDAARQFPESAGIQAAVAEAQQALRAQAGARAVEACAREARTDVERADHDAALQVLERALETYPDEPVLLGLLDSVLEKRAAWLRRQEIDRAVQRAGSLSRSGLFSEASDLLREELQRFHGEPALEEARQQLERDWARHQRTQEVAAAVRQARTLLDEGRPEAAADFLLQTGSRYPGEAALEKLLARARQAVVVEHVCRGARPLVARQEFGRALELIGQGLKNCPGEPSLISLQREAEAGLTVIRREEAIGDALRLCGSLAGQERFADALRLAETSLRTYPGDAGLLAARSEMRTRLEEAERLHRRAADRDALDRLAGEAQSVTGASGVGGLREKVRAIADRYPSDAEIIDAARQTLEQLSAMQEAGSLFAKQDYAAVLALCAKYPGHRFFERLKSEAERGEMSARIAEVRQQVREEPDLMRRAELLDRTTRLYPDAPWLRQESQVVQDKLDRVESIVGKARQAEAGERWDEALEQWRAVREIYKDYPDLAKEMERVAVRQEQARAAARERLGEQLRQDVNTGDYDALRRSATEFPGRTGIAEAPAPPVTQSRRVPKFAWAGLAVLGIAIGAWAIWTWLHAEGVLIVETAPAAILSLDGSVAGQAGGNGMVSIRKAPGRHTLVVAKPGFESAHQVVDLKFGVTSRVKVALNPAGSAAPLPAPSIASLDPGSVMPGSAFTLTITGAGFQPGATVRWNGSGLSTTFAAPTRLQASVPAPLVGKRGRASITVVNPGSVASGPVSLSINPSAPGITGLSPASAAAGGAAFTLTVTGAGFALGATLRWNETELSTKVAGGNKMTAAVPASLIASPGSAGITAINPGNVASIPVTFSIDPLTPAPAISNLNPRSATAAGSSFLLTVTGTGFGRGAVVRWNRQALPTTVSSTTQLRAEVPASAISSPGNAAITVVNPGNVSSGAFNISIGAPTPAPGIATLNPGSITAGAAFTLSVSGTGFAPGSTVLWNKLPLSTTFAAATQLRATVPPHLTGSAGNVAITVVNPGDVSSGSTNFTIQPATQTPAISGLNPASTAAGGPALSLTVTGTGFAPGAVVQWNQTALGTTFNNAQQLRATVPANLLGAAGGARVTVVNPGNVSSNTSTIVINPPAVAPSPVISGISPGSATAAGAGIVLTVTGTGFQPGAAVQWNKSAIQTTFSSTRELSATVPAGLISSPGNATITVVNPGNAVSGPVRLAINPPRTDPDAEEIKAVIAEFAAAMRQQNVRRVTELWPKVPKSTRDLLRDIQNRYSLDYKLAVTTTPVVEGDQARVRASRTTVISKDKQTLSETPVTEVVVHLKKTSGKWTITSME